MIKLSFNSLGNLSCHCLGTPAAAASHIYGYLDSSTAEKINISRKHNAIPAIVVENTQACMHCLIRGLQ